MLVIWVGPCSPRRRWRPSSPHCYHGRAATAVVMGAEAMGARPWRDQDGGTCGRHQRGPCLVAWTSSRRAENRWGARANPAGGRKPATDRSGFRCGLAGIGGTGARGDPESPLRWTTKSLRRLQTELAAAGHRVSAPTVAIAAQWPRACSSAGQRGKSSRGPSIADRDAQFRLPQRPGPRPQAHPDPAGRVGQDRMRLARAGRVPGWRRPSGYGPALSARISVNHTASSCVAAMPTGPALRVGRSRTREPATG